MLDVRSVRFFVGPMSLEVIEGLLEFCDENSCHELFGMIPSRRQIDVPAGYVGSMSTHDFVRKIDGRIVIQRDHAGPQQGAKVDDGLDSLAADVRAGIHAIHIDPWKYNRKCAVSLTQDLIKHCDSIDAGHECSYEIGTEEWVAAYSAQELDSFITKLSTKLDDDQISRITHCVIQSGTSIVSMTNGDHFNAQKADEMVRVALKHGLLPKEHNADYLTQDAIKRRINAGIWCLNFAPEFGVRVTQVLLDELDNANMRHERNEFIRIACHSGKWVRWVGNRLRVSDTDKARLCGHYVFADAWVAALVAELSSRTDFVTHAKDAVKERLREFLCLVNQ